MSIELDARFWDNQSTPSHKRFITMIDAIDTWLPAAREWRGLQVIDRSIVNVVYRSTAAINSAELKAIANQFQSDAYRFSTSTVIPCWRFTNNQPQRGINRLWVSSWGPTFANSAGRASEMEGLASLSFTHSGPYVALLKYNGPQAELEKINAHVEENLEQYTQLLFAMIDHLAPKRIKVFTDAGQYLNLNAHFAYYRDVEDVLYDVELLKMFSTDGFPRYNIPSLKTKQFLDKSSRLHLWRPATMQKTVWQRMKTVTFANATTARVSQLLESGKFDVYSCPVGFAILEYPHMLNAFLDRFYFELCR